MMHRNPCPDGSENREPLGQRIQNYNRTGKGLMSGKQAAQGEGRFTAEDLLDNVGLVRGLSFTPATARRHHSLTIKLGLGTEAQLLRTLSLNGRDFNSVFDEAIDAIIAWRGVRSKALIQAMKDSRDAFMSYYGLSYLKVSYTTVSYDPSQAVPAGVKRAARH
jgi:hypothetical protein